MEKALEHLVAAVERVERAVASLETSVASIKTQSRVNRFLATGLTVVLILVIGNLFYVRKSFCEHSNAANLKQQQLWANIVKLSTRDQPPPDPKVLQAFDKLLLQAYPIQDCSSAYWKL